MGHTKSWEAHECDQQLWKNESEDIWLSERLPKEGNARMIKLLAMGLGLAKINQESTYFKKF